MSLKSQQKYRSKHKGEYKEWGKKSEKKNRWKYKERTNKRVRELREIAIELGRCSKCFKEKDDPKRKTCKKCRDYYRDWYHRQKLKK